MRTPYGKENDKEIYYKYVQRGYAVVIQDVREEMNQKVSGNL